MWTFGSSLEQFFFLSIFHQMPLFLSGFYEILLVFCKQSQYVFKYTSTKAFVYPSHNNGVLKKYRFFTFNSLELFRKTTVPKKVGTFFWKISIVESRSGIPTPTLLKQGSNERVFPELFRYFQNTHSVDYMQMSCNL